MRLERNSAPLDLASCIRDERTDWFIGHREHLGRMSFLQSVELVKECLGMGRSQVDAALSQIAAKHISIPEPTLVRRYLMDHIDLLDIVVITSSAVAARFSENAQLLLTVYCDPEIQDKYLTLYVREAEYQDDFLDTLHAVYADYAARLAGKSGWFQVTTDFVPAAR
jgi:hypothetical protein